MSESKWEKGRLLEFMIREVGQDAMWNAGSVAKHDVSTLGRAHTHTHGLGYQHEVSLRSCICATVGSDRTVTHVHNTNTRWWRTASVM